MKKIAVIVLVSACFATAIAEIGPWIIDGSSGLGYPLNAFFKTVGCAVQYGSVINLTSSSLENQAGAFWTKVPLQTREFTYVVGLEVHPRPRSVRSADGFTLVLCSKNGALGEPGENLGFAGQFGNHPRVEPSFASIFKYFAVRPNGERVEHSYAGYFMNGERIPVIPEQSNRFVDLTARRIELATGHFFAISLQYKNGVLNTVIDDLTSGVWTQYATRVDLSRIVGEYAYFGMTGSTGAETSAIKVHGVAWTDKGDPSVIGMATKRLAESAGKAPMEAREPSEPTIWLSGPWE